MRTAFLLLAAAAVVSASAVSESDESSSNESQGSLTRPPCPDICTADYNPVCAMDKHGNLYRFSNHCMMLACRCKMCCGNWLRQVPLHRCPEDAPGCPVNSGRPSHLGSAVSSQESKSAPFSQKGGRRNSQLGSAVSSQESKSAPFFQKSSGHRTNALRHDSESEEE